MASIATRKGDDGTTGLLYGQRVPKDHPQIEAVGTLDELNTALGAAKALLAAHPRATEVRALIEAVSTTSSRSWARSPAPNPTRPATRRPLSSRFRPPMSRASTRPWRPLRPAGCVSTAGRLRGESALGRAGCRPHRLPPGRTPAHRADDFRPHRTTGIAPIHQSPRRSAVAARPRGGAISTGERSARLNRCERPPSLRPCLSP